jgi:ketosteroid isomerase-like protein
MTTAADDQDVEAIRAVVADTEALQSDADGFAGLLTENVALVNFGGRRVLGRDNVRVLVKERGSCLIALAQTTPIAV